ncbi:RluA family pseudouridine synthase [Altererythrobacter ishigakiensis]|uniref:Pseudouridine synthase n=1 Tax=Altererythrobacter ishigakiensis TaxID=476157 RepID=A0A562UV29_9SPHN|nr:RluA family pseudouridine synthase [Altererythrobacter ishigakiensis]TWJ09408.1 ribosomal large subunit pseudouridine synthase C [Altererythrobacter ishigakiensis]
MSERKFLNEVRQFTISDDDDGVRLDRWFKRNLPQIGFGTVSKWARTGQIRVDGKRAKPDDRLTSGQVLRVPPGGEQAGRKPKPRRELKPEEIAEAKAMVVKETKSAIVLNKSPGLATQGGSKTNKHVDGLLDAFVEDEDTPRPRLVHRLDKDTSGVLLIARTPGSAASYSKRFSGRSARKVYWALIVGVPDVKEGTIDAPLAKQPGTGGEKMHVDMEGGQPAKTRYRVVETAGKKAAWVELEPLTGRTHQLRVHMEAIGHPIVGDGKYGGQDAFLTGSISRKMHLHARRLIITEPGGGKLDVTAELPEHFAASMEQLGFDIALSDAKPLREDNTERTKAEKKQAAKAHAKQYRKSRRGERRTRTTSKASAKKGAKSGKHSGKGRKR